MRQKYFFFTANQWSDKFWTISTVLIERERKRKKKFDSTNKFECNTFLKQNNRTKWLLKCIYDQFDDIMQHQCTRKYTKAKCMVSHSNSNLRLFFSGYFFPIFLFLFKYTRSYGIFVWSCVYVETYSRMQYSI